MILFVYIAVAVSLASADHWEPAAGAVRAYNQGVEALERDDPVEAEQKLRKALRRDPECGMCGYALASALLRQDRALEALELAAEVSGRFPSAVDPAVTHADAAFAAERFDESIAVAEGLLLRHPESWESLRILVRGLLRTGDTARARAALQQGAEHHSAECIACELGKVALEEGATEEARAHLDDCRRSENPEAAASLEARVLAAEGRYQEAGAALSDDADPRLSSLLRAHELMEAGSHDEAAELLRESLEHGGDDAETAVLLGLCELQLGRTDQAIVALEQAFEGETWITVGRSGELWGVLTASGERIFHMRMHEGAARLVMLLVAAGREDDARSTLARAQQELGASGELAAAELSLLVAAGRYADGAAEAVRSLERWPESALLLHTASVLGTEHAEARSPELDQALARVGEWRSIHNGAAQLARDGAFQECLDKLQQAPVFDDPQAQARLAQLAHSCASGMGDLEAADRALETLGGLQYAEPWVLVNHAGLLHRDARDDEALAMLRAAGEVGEQGDLGLVRRSLLVAIHSRQQDVDAALAVLEGGAVYPVEQLNLGLALANQQRWAEAAELLREACPQLDEGPRRHCEHMLGTVEEQL